MTSTVTTLAPPRGMRDVYPADMAVRRRIFDAWRLAAERFGFQEYDACVVESLDLLKRKAGEEIVEQIYAFKDKSDRDLALRPEMTPTLARMIAARQGALDMPLKWFAVAQCFRYERTTRGRKREHFQWNLDIVGEPAVTAEIEVAAAAVHALAAMGLARDDVRVHVNSRALLAELLSAAGIAPAQHAAAFLALDKRGKLTDDAIAALMREAGMDAAAVTAAFRLLNLETLDQAAAMLPAPTPALQRLQAFFAGLDAYGIGDIFRFDLSVIRGLAYYTGIVFEAFDRERKLRALFGGGRYDNLLQAVGGKPETGVGLGFGDVVVTELLAERGLIAAVPPRARLGLGYMQEAQRDAAMRLAAALRHEGQAVDLALRPEKPRTFFARADKRRFAGAAYIGPDDIAAGSGRVKDLETGVETPIALP